MTKKTNPRKDFTQIAFDIVQKASGETEPEEPIDEKKKAAIESGWRGGLKGGKSRADKLTPEKRSEIAKKAAQIRWNKDEQNILEPVNTI
ncbi:MAG: histone H1 [Nitrosomonas sp.]|uniref:histone H1 n=1 Tax=Nitrosomonas sp. TaxID=42353 RepID=UPI0025DDF87E|nr:histone H1 [Nitrosomonas sp.]UJP01766.1 MAG: histone H1 [Nitrosomonas sp.]